MKRILIFLALALLSMNLTHGQETEPRPFITTWTISDSDDLTHTLKLAFGINYDFSYVWKDNDGNTVADGTFISSSSSLDNEPLVTIFQVAGTYSLEILGDFPSLLTQPNIQQLADVKQWGNIEFKDFSFFNSWPGSAITAIDTPVFKEDCNLDAAFFGSSFNQDISNWDVSNVNTMYSMFQNSSFNQDISGWNVSNVEYMGVMFKNSSFNQDIGSWDVRNVLNMKDMFTNSVLSADNYDKTLIGWQVRGGLKDNVELGAGNRTFCKSGAARDKLITDFKWQITDGGQLCPFITSWQVSQISGTTNVEQVILKMTDGLTYNFNYIWRNAQGDKVSSGNIISANVPSGEFVSSFPESGEYTLEITGSFPHFNRTSLANIRKLADVKQWGDIAWQSMKSSFERWPGSAFTATDAPNLTSVTDMSGMFQSSPFNQDISSWNVSKVVNMSGMFLGSSFNQDISSWNVGSVENMSFMFGGSPFNQDIGGWNVSKVTTMADMFTNTGLSIRNYDNILIGWAKLTNLQNNVVLDVSSDFCNSSAAQTKLKTFGWEINDFGQGCRSFTTTWNIGNAATDEVTLKMTDGVDYNFGYVLKNAQGDEVFRANYNISSEDISYRLFVIDTFPASGVYTLEITGVFPHLNIEENSVDKLIDVKQWGNIEWKSMVSSFENWQGTSFSATDTPDLRGVSSMKSLFSGAVNFNGAIGNWDVSNITDMSTMFKGSGFNQDISGWKIVKVTTMENMFLDGQLSTKNYDKMLIGWNNLALEEVINSQVKLGVGTTTYCEAGSARTNLILDLLWEFTDGGQNCPSDETDILSFTLAEQTGAAIIDNIAHTVEIEVASTADITSLQIFMTLSPGAESNPVSGATVNFTLPESFIVTAADGVVQEWTIFVTQEEPSLGVPEQEQLQVSVYPNPFEEVVYIKAAKPFSISLTNMSGAHLRQAKSEGELQLNLAGLSPGMYLLVIKNEDGVTTQKLIKK